MGKITGLWLSAMMLLAVVAMSTAPMFGPGVAAASNHETGTIEVTDASATKTNGSGTYDAPFSVVPGTEFRVEFTAENTGDRDSTKQVAVTVDGEQVEQVDVALDSGQQTNKTLPVALDDTGEHDLAVDGVLAGTVTVVEPPNITVTETAVNRTTVTRGEHIEVTHTLENTGGKTGALTVTPTLKNTDTGESQMVNELDVEVGGGDTETASWTLDTGTLGELSAGEYELQDGSGSSPTITIEESTRFTVEYSRLSDESTVTDDPVELTVWMENPRDGDGTATEDVVLRADGTEIATRTVEIENGGTKTLEFSPTFDSEGTYDLTINGESVGSVEVADEASIQVQDAGLIDTQVNTDTDTGGIGTREPELWVTVENTGGQSGTITLPIEVGGTQVGQESIPVPTGETVNETVRYRLEDTVDEGDHEVTVGGVTAGTLTVGQPDIQITDASWNRTTVTRGDAAELAVTARNDGTVTAGREFWVETENEVPDAVSFDLAPGESGTDTYVHTFEESGTYQFTVGSKTQTVTVEQPATFEVSDRALNTTSVSEGESVAVTATVANTGDQAGTYEVPLTVADERADATELQLGPGESTTVSFTESFTAVGTYPIDLDGERVGSVRVSEAATFETTSVDLNRTDVVTGEPIAVAATVRNEGDQTGSADVRLQEDGTTIDTQSVTLDGGEETTLTFVQSFSDAGSRDIAVDNQFGARVTVTEPAAFEISNAAVSSESVTQGGAVELSATVTNTGGQAGSVTGNFSVANFVVESREVTLDGGEAREITYEHVFNNSGNYVVDVNGERAGTVTVKEPAAFNTTTIKLNRTSTRTGEPIEVTATVVNNGDETGTSPVRLQTNDDIVDTTNVTLSGGQQTEVTFVYVFESGGEYDVAVNSDSGGNISVTQPATFEVRDAQLSNSSTETGESVDVTATVANIGTEGGNYTAALTENNQTLKSRTIGPIAGGETVTVFFSISFDSEGNRSLAIGNATTETLAVEAESSSDDGGGGGGGGGFNFNDESDETDDGGGAEAPAISQSQIDNGVTVEVTADAANSTVSQSLNRSGPSETTPAITLSELSLNVTNESDGFNATLLGPHATPNDMAAVQEDGVRGYVTVTSGANASAISRATYTLQLNESALPANGSMDAVRVFQYHNKSWSQLPVTVNPANRSIRATSSNLSTIAVASPVASASTVEASDSSNTNTSTPTPTELTVADASLMADWVRDGFNTSARATVENPTDEPVEQTLTVTVDGDPVASQTVRLNAGEQTTVTIEFAAVDGAVAVNGVSAGDLRVGSDAAQSTGGSGAAETGESGGGAEPAAETVAASGPGFTVQLVALVLALIAGLVRVHRRV